jgi:hypothetical protein
MSGSLRDLQEQVQRLQFVVTVLMAELRRVSGPTPALDYLQKILAPQGRQSVLPSEERVIHPQEGQPNGKTEL